MTGRVERDEWGVPHVVADSVDEVGFLQGHAVAGDRSWQLEHSRLRAEGRTASVLGESGVPWDRFARRVQLEGLARRAYDALAPATSSFVDSFVAGVNQGLGELGEVAELAALGTEPGHWQPWTPLGVFAAHHVLFASFPTKLWRRHLAETVGTEVAAVFHDEGLWVPGSNAWAVGGARTASGLPMVGGDPHRSFESPNTYQQVRLSCTDPEAAFDVAGFTFPGVPGVQHFAHAGSVAWGITNAMGDYQDVFEVRLERRRDEVWSEGADGWRRAAAHVETIEVRDAPDEPVEVVTTESGPVFVGGPDAPLSFALLTPSLVRGELGFDCLLPLLRARTAADVEAALSRWVEPVNNLVVADASGDVRQRVVGVVPRRAEENRWRPVPGWEGRTRWQGWVDDLPFQSVPPQGHVVTANHRMNADFDRVGTEFAPPGRATRIDALLTGRDRLTPEDFAAIHRDTLAGQPAVLADAVAALDGLSVRATALQQEIARWDQHLTAGSTTAAAYVAVRDALVTGLAKAPPFDALADGCPFDELFDPWFTVSHQLFLSLANLFSDEGRKVVPDLDGHLAAAVEQVAAAPSPGEWGARHRFRPLHVLGAELEDAPMLAGDNDCVRCAGGVPGSVTAFRGSVARYVWDLAGFGSSGWVVPLGASGDPADPHHHDQTAAWAEGLLLPLPFSQTVARPGGTP